MSTQRISRAVASFAAALVCSIGFAQWSFDLDTAFRTEITMKNVNALHALQDGKIFISGRVRFSGDLSDRGSARLLEDGQRDLSFPSFPQTTGGEKTTPWLNGKFYVSNGLPRRMMPDGLIDPSFGPLGIGPYFQPSTTGDYHVFPDGRVLISGSHLLSDSIRGFEGYYELIWFTNTGYLDTTRLHRNANGPIWDFKELPNGQFICTCNCSMYDGQSVSKLFRVNADLTLDPTFQPGINWGNIFAYHGLPDGRVYVGGRYKRAAAPNDTLYIARFMPDGALDPSFAIPSVEMGSLSADYGPILTCLQPWDTNYVIASGEFGLVNETPRESIFMIDANGSLTTSFTGFQVGIYAGQFGNSASINGITLVSTDTLYVCGVYAGLNDGNINDTLQRFVSRLLVEDIGMSLGEQDVATLNVYPNPACTTATLELQATPADAQVVMRDALGREVLRQRVQARATTLLLQSLADGIYTLELHSAGQRLAVQQLVIQH